MSRSFLDQIKYIVETPSEWPRNHGHLAVCGPRYEEVKKDFHAVPRDVQTKRDLLWPTSMGVNICVDESVPPNEIRFVSYTRNPATNEYEPRVDRIINVSVP